MPLPQQVDRPETFPALNGLRFLAALAIVIFHYAPRVENYSRVPPFLRNLIAQGPCAVGFFFILSGFVLAHRHLQRGLRTQSAAEFYWARFVRLYPAYFLALLLFFPIALQRSASYSFYGFAGHHNFVLSAILSCLMLQSWTPLAQAWNGPSWSLSVEAFMYLAFPWAGMRLARLSRLGAGAVALVCWLIPCSVALVYVAGSIPEHIWGQYVTNNPLLWLPLFLMGICASRFAPPWKGVAAHKAKLVTLGALILLLFTWLIWPHKWADVFVTGGVAPLLLLVIVCCTRITGWAACVLGGRLLAKAGEVSYATYILQAPLWHYWQPMTNYMRHASSQASTVPLWQFALFVPFLIASSFGVQHFVEVPVRMVFHGWKQRKTSPVGPTFQTAHLPAIAISEFDPSAEG